MGFKKLPVYELLCFVLVLFAGLWFISFGAVGKHLEFFPGDLADARFNMYLLEHAYQFFSGKETEFWSAGFMYPEPKVISYSDNLLGAAPFYAIFRVFGADRETSFQLWYLFMSALNFTTAYLFLRFLVKQPLAAMCGAFVFAFSLALHSQSVHAQTFPRFMVPLIVWAAVLYQRELRPRYFFLCLLAWVYQMYCGIYLGFLALVPLLMILVISAVSRFGKYKLRMKSTRWWLLMGGAVIANILCLLPVMLPYLQRAKTTGFYPYEQVLQSLPTPQSFLYARHGTLFWERLQDFCVSYDNFWDFILFPGGTVIACSFIVMLFVAAYFLLKQKRWMQNLDSSVLLMLGVGVLVGLLFIRIGKNSMYYLLYVLPGFGSMRALQRIVNIELLFFGMAVAIVAARILRFGKMGNAIIFAGLITVLIADNFSRHDYFDKTLKSATYTRVNALMARIPPDVQTKVLSYEPDTTVKAQIFFQLDAMLAAQTLGMKTLNGYTATSPPGFDAYWRHPDPVSRRIWIDQSGLDSTLVYVVN